MTETEPMTGTNEPTTSTNEPTTGTNEEDTTMSEAAATMPPPSSPPIKSLMKGRNWADEKEDKILRKSRKSTRKESKRQARRATKIERAKAAEVLAAAGAPPPRPCSCGQTHWANDCPRKSTSTPPSRPAPQQPATSSKRKNTAADHRPEKVQAVEMGTVTEAVESLTTNAPARKTPGKKVRLPAKRTTDSKAVNFSDTTRDRRRV